MQVDVIKTTSSDVTQSSTILYVELQTGATGYKSYQVQGDAPWGGVTTSHMRKRERFAITYEQSTVTVYQWNNVEFVQSSDGTWIARLQQDQLLDSKWWFKGSDRTATFGTGSGQFDLTTTDDKFLAGYLTTLCTQEDVEQLALSHLQGRMRFAESVPTNQVGNQIMSHGDLWKMIYITSAMFQSKLSRTYSTPLRLGSDIDQRVVADYASKHVLMQVLMRLHLTSPSRAVVELVDQWSKAINAWLDNPEGLNAEKRSMRGGAFRVERA